RRPVRGRRSQPAARAAGELGRHGARGRGLRVADLRQEARGTGHPVRSPGGERRAAHRARAVQARAAGAVGPRRRPDRDVPPPARGHAHRGPLHVRPEERCRGARPAPVTDRGDDVIETRDVPADPALPDLAKALDETAMRAILSEALQAGGGAPLERCTITWIKYRPGRSCTVAWRLLLGDGAASTEQRAYGRMFPPGTSMERFVRTSTARRVPTAAGPAVLHLAEHDMVVWLFPNDRKLHGLEALTDPAMLRDVLLPEILVGRWGSGWRPV